LVCLRQEKINSIKSHNRHFTFDSKNISIIYFLKESLINFIDSFFIGGHFDANGLKIHVPICRQIIISNSERLKNHINPSLTPHNL